MSRGYVFDSELDCESAISTINSYVQNEITKPRERSFDPIQKAEKYWLMDDLKVEAIYTELSNCIETHNYTLIELFKILSFAHFHNLFILSFISRFLTTYTYKKPIRIGGVEKTKGNFFNNKKSLTKS